MTGRGASHAGRRLALAFQTLVLIVCAAPARADVVTLGASKDNTLYESQSGALSNALGQYLFAGKTNIPEIRRGLIAFNVAGAVPAGSTITSVTLTLSMSLTIAQDVRVSLYRVSADWGEGSSQATGTEGMGAPATPGDATWVHTFSNTLYWNQPGGDFSVTPSASINVIGNGFYTWGSTAEMVADAQSWLAAPSGNYGWEIVADESTFPTAKRFDSSQNTVPAVRPVLRIEFTPPPSGSGRVPDGGPTPGTPLTVDRAPGGDLTLRWGASCATTDTDYAVYEGTLGSFDSHTPRFCSTSGATFATFTPAAASSYYLVVPTNAGREGSYGLRSNLTERPASTAACVPQAIAACF